MEPSNQKNNISSMSGSICTTVCKGQIHIVGARLGIHIGIRCTLIWHGQHNVTLIISIHI